MDDIAAFAGEIEVRIPTDSSDSDPISDSESVIEVIDRRTHDWSTFSHDRFVLDAQLLADMSLPEVLPGTYRAHVIDHRQSQQFEPTTPDGSVDGADPMPSPRSARLRSAARAQQDGNAKRGAYAPPTRGTRALYIPTPRKTHPAAATAAPVPAPPVRRPSAAAAADEEQPAPALSAVAASATGPSRPPPWWWPDNLESSAEGLPQSLASMLASQMVKVAAGPEGAGEGPTPALPPAARKRALNTAATPLSLVKAAVRTRAPPEPPAPQWAQFEVPILGAQWRGDPVAPSMVRTQELQRAGNEKIFESADALVLDAEALYGPMVQLTPHGCKFTGEPVRMSFQIDRLVEDYEGDAFIVVMRKRSGGGTWLPLEEDERLSISPSGLAVVELREFCWLKAWCFRTENQDNDVSNLLRTALKPPWTRTMTGRFRSPS